MIVRFEGTGRCPYTEGPKLKFDGTGCFKKMSKIFKSLTFIFLCFAFSREIIAETTFINQEKFKTHLRWNIFAGKDDVYISKKGSSVFIKTLNVDLFEALKKDIAQIGLEKSYVAEIKSYGNDKPDNAGEDSASTVEIKLVADNIELFSFYRDREKKYVVDFWSDVESMNAKTPELDSASKKVESKKISEVKKPIPTASLATTVVPEKKEEIVKPELVLVTPSPLPALPGIAPEKKEEAQEVAISFSRNKGVRDFRYGASFIYDYTPISPVPPRLLDLESKTAEEFYPVQDRQFEKDNKESHIQLTINFYRQKKWGLMAKSINLFEQKYGATDVVDLFEYLRANALLRDNMVKKDEASTKTAIGMYKNIVDRSKDYELSKGIQKYLLQFYISRKQYVDALQVAKVLYATAKQKFDIEDARDAAEYMFYSLAQLNQVDKIRELAQDKSLTKLLNTQLRLAYEFFAMSALKKNAELITSFEANKKSLTKPIEPSIVFNAAEAYFRVANYSQALELFDDFVTKNSQMTAASFARTRMALVYDLLDKDYNELVKLYKAAINRSQNDEASFEAKIRYVALRAIRKIKPSAEDKETRIFLEKDDLAKNVSNHDLMKLLWLVRFRTYIVDKDYTKALTYLAALPLDKMDPTDVKVFEADGAEVVYGMIIDDYRNSDYSHLIKLWEVYKDRFLTKVAVDPYMNFIVGHSYLKLGLNKGFDRLISNFEKLQGTPVKTFPVWNDVKAPQNSLGLIAELKVIKEVNEKDWEKAEAALENLSKVVPNNNKIHYYKGIMAYAKKDSKTCASEFETYLGNQTHKEIYDSSEVAELLRAYTDSLYDMNQFEKFSKVSEAIMQDVADYGVKNVYMNKVKERISYLTIEILAGKNTPESFLQLESEVKDFEKKYKDSIYISRLKYLLGVAFVANRKLDEGKLIFKNLLEDKQTADYIKELVKTELSTMKIKEKTL